MVAPREIVVFIASPGDVEAERRVFRKVVDDLNKGFGDGAGVRFKAVGWEDVRSVTGHRVQSVINREIDACHAFVLVLHRRWGQEADSKHSSYTEEEFRHAFSLWEKKKSPEIFVFLKNIDTDSMADPGKQLKKVMAFRKKLEKSHLTLAKRFAGEAEFAEQIDDHLRAFARGEWNKYNQEAESVDLPTENIDSLNRLTVDLTLAEADRSALVKAQAAVTFASQNKVEEATLLFSQACAETTNLEILSAGAEFFKQIGDAASSDRLNHRRATLAEDRGVAARYYMSLLSERLLADLINSMIDVYPPEIADEARSFLAQNGTKLFDHMREVMVQLYSVAEIRELVRFMASAEGQAITAKQPLLVSKMAEFGRREAERGTELQLRESKTIEGVVNRQITDAQDAGIKPS